MRFIFSNAIYVVAIAIYSFFTLPFLLPLVEAPLQLKKKDVAIVLGGGVKEDCTIGESVQARMNGAIGLFHQKKVRKILVSGGPKEGPNNCVEATSMRAYALEKGIPEKAIIIEDKASNTYQNAYYSVVLMKEKRLKRAYVVTSAYHTKRANLIFQQYNIDYQVIPTENAILGRSNNIPFFREQIILCFHALFGIPDRFGLDVEIEDKQLLEIMREVASL